MMRYFLRIYGDPVLKRKCEPVDEIDDEMKSISEKMFEIMYANDGIGLAAPQIGVLKRIIVVEVEGKSLTLINPEIIWQSDETEITEEGCLSFPGIFTEVERAKRTRVKYITIDNEEKVVEGEGLSARVFQHEIDHLNGILFIDRISVAKREMLKGELEALKRQYRKRKYVL